MIFLDALIEFVMWVIECAILSSSGNIEPRRASLLDLSPAEGRARRWRLVIGGVTMLVIAGIALVVLAAFS